MFTQMIDNSRKSPKVLVENKISFGGPDSELSIYDTYQQASRVQLKSDQLLFCAMVTGKKIMHATENDFDTDFLPHESFIMTPDSQVEIDFPIAQPSDPTTCLAIEISKDKINQVASQLNESSELDKDFGHWEYQNRIVHTHHNAMTQELLNRIVRIYGENHQDRNALISLAVTELTIRLLRHQTRDLILNFSQQQPEHNGLTAALNYIEQHLNENIEGEKLAKIACMSRTKFFNEFKRNLGCTPMAYQLQTRLNRAAEMIKNGQTVTVCCFSLGFCNTSHFSRCFKQFFGMSPRQYKQRHLDC